MPMPKKGNERILAYWKFALATSRVSSADAAKASSVLISSYSDARRCLKPVRGSPCDSCSSVATS